jgi:glycosyltransferase involved in cell wall biosynthesis
MALRNTTSTQGLPGVDAATPLTVAMIEPVGGHGGMNYYDFGLCRGLVEAGVMPTLYTCDETDVPPGLPFTVSSSYRRIFGRYPVWQRGLRYVSGSLHALIGARIAGSRVAHFHIFHVRVLELFNVFLAKLLLIRVVITAHDVEAFRGEWSGIKPWVYRLADCVIAHNAVSKRELVRVLGISERKIHVIPHGNYLGHLGAVPTAGSARARLDLPPDAQVLLFFGQIKEVKGLDLLLNALATVKGMAPEVYLMVAGKMWGQDFAPYQSQIKRLGLDGHCVAHIRYIADDEVATYYAAADLVVLPYRRIYQSGVILMAMSYGKPVLASDLDGMKEVIEDKVNGFLFRAGDAADLARQLLAALADPAGMQRVAAKGLELMHDDYGWERIGQLTADCYRQAMRGSSNDS